jgi:hypothetical protein
MRYLRALAGLLEEIRTRRERAALDAHPYEDDPDLNWEVSTGPSLPYDGAVPPEVRELAKRRRRRG